MIDEADSIIAGHWRILAAQLFKLEMPCIRLDYLTPAQKKAYVIADNKLALNAGWDDEMLRLELGDLQAEGYDLDLTGFSDEELEGLSLGNNDPETPDNENNPDDKTNNDDDDPGHTKGSLSDKFIVPPFSVLSASDGFWQNRKKHGLR